MEISVKYTELKDRAVRLKEQEAKGLRMLHDNFDDPNWKHGDPIVGTMIFTDEPSVAITSEPVRDLLAEIDELKAKIEKLEIK